MSVVSIKWNVVKIVNKSWLFPCENELLITTSSLGASDSLAVADGLYRSTERKRDRVREMSLTVFSARKN